MLTRRLLSSSLGIFALAVGAHGALAQPAPPPPSPAPEFQLPVACDVGKTCFVQHYVDDDPGPGARDYNCGTLTYNGHDGVDIRVPTLKAMQDGVNVLAAAAGTVRGARNDMPDRLVKETEMATVAGRECGNGVVLQHAGGWETQYCHMAAGSVLVKSGDTVSAGQVLGRIGLSGATQFPHVHFTVRQDRKAVDPFAFGATAGSCGGGRSLWAPAVQSALAYRAPAVLNAGFADAPVTMEGIESAAAGAKPIDAAAPAIIAFVRAIGLGAGDVIGLKLSGPDGAVLAQDKAEPLDRSKDQYMKFVGKRRPASGWPPGRYVAVYTITRGGKVALEHRFEVAMPGK